MTLKRQLGGYASIGLLQWLLEYGVMVGLSAWFMPVAQANIIGRLLGASLGFWLNGRFTFKGDGRALSTAALVRFVLMFAGLTALNTVLVTWVHAHVGLRTTWALKPGLDAITGTLGFLLSRHWVYTHRARS